MKHLHADHLHCFPWHHFNVPLTRLEALYLAIGQGYEILKKMKKNYREQLVPLVETALPETLAKWDFLVPLPPTRLRELEFRAPWISKLSSRISKKLDVPKLPVLDATSLWTVVKSGHTPSRQAESSYQDRIGFKPRFQLSSRINALALRGQRVILFDDFMTTGSTLRSALFCISQTQPKEVAILVLGYRPSLWFKSGLNLNHSNNYDET